jgi:uncharacterized protein (TIGR02145 family)
MAKDYVEILNDGSGDRYVRDAEAQAGIAQVASAIGTDADYEFVDLGLPSGTIWAKCNVGATLETNYGNFYKYGKGSAQYDSSQADYTGTENPLAAAADTATQVMGAPWHMPTREQFEELVANTTYTWVTNFNGSGVKGSKFTAANGNYVFFPAAGDIREGSTEYVNVQGRYWSSTPSESSGGAYAILMYSGGTVTSNAYYTYFGYSVRGVASSLDLLTDVKGELNNRYTKTEVDQKISDEVAALKQRVPVTIMGNTLVFATDSKVSVSGTTLVIGQ